MKAEDLYSKIEAIIDKESKALLDKVPDAEKQLFEKILARSKSLEVNGDGEITRSIFNVKEIQNITSSISNIIDQSSWSNMSAQFATTLYDINDLQNKYFTSLKEEMPPKEFMQALQKKVQADVIEDLSGDSLKASIKGTINDILRTATTDGAKFSDYVSSVQKALVSTNDNPGAVLSHSKTIVTDTIAANSRAYENAIAGHIGLEWGMYIGNNIATTAPFCLAATDRRYWHKSQIPGMLRIEFPEFKDRKVKISDKTGLPTGMPANENASNFTVLLGHRGCRHRWIWVSDNVVPAVYRDAIS